MDKKVLILTSHLTGHGHKSITESLCQQFEKIGGVKVEVVDGFELGGHFGLRIGKLYGSVTRTAKDLWKIVWEMSSKRPKLVNDFTAAFIRENFIKLIKNMKPDLILSVHPDFVGSVLDLRKEMKLDTPFVTLLADLVSITPLWADSRSDYTICPTVESQMRCVEFGVPENRTRLFSFPVRENFCLRDNEHSGQDSFGKKPVTFLIMSGGEGVGNMSLIARKLLKSFDCRVKILCGRNKILKARMEKNLGLLKYPGRVDIYGFTDKVYEVMRESDIAVTRGSPNVIMEAVNSALPLIITGALPGQEAENPNFVKKNKLGVVCTDFTKLVSTAAELLADNGKKLLEIRNSQMQFRDPDAAKKIAEFLVGVIEDKQKEADKSAHDLLVTR